MPSPAEVQRLIAVMKNSSSTKERAQAIQELGHLKARIAVPLLLKLNNLKSLKRSNEIMAARYALPQIVDISESLIICIGCGAANPSDAGFCHSCGMQVSRPTATSEEITELIGLVKNNSGEQQFQAIERLGQLGSRAAIPALLDLFGKWAKVLTFRVEALLVLEALVEIGAPDVVPQLSKLSKLAAQSAGTFVIVPENLGGKDWTPVYEFDATVHSLINALVRLNRLDVAAKYFEPLIKPDKHDKNGINLRFVLEAAEICGVGAISPLCGNIMKEKSRWDPGIGYLIVYPDPLALLVTVAMSVGSNLLNRAMITSQGQSAAALMVPHKTVDPKVLKDMPLQARKIVALHCYSTALATIASRDSAPVKAELSVRKKPLERAVISLALAQNGDPSVGSVLKQLRSDSDWTVRLLAYEGLIVLADVAGRAPGPDQLAALQDSDVRVRTAVARVMVSTGDATYAPHILTLTDSSDKKQRKAVLPVIAILASTGHQPAVVKLQQLAQGDPDEQVREGARAILRDISSSSVP